MSTICSPISPPNELARRAFSTFLTTTAIDLLDCIIAPSSPTPLRTEEMSSISSWLISNSTAPAATVEIWLMRHTLNRDVMLESFLIISTPPYPPPANIQHQIQTFGLSNLGNRHGVYVKLKVVKDPIIPSDNTFEHVIYRSSTCALGSLPPPPISWGTSLGRVGEKGFLRFSPSSTSPPPTNQKLKVCLVTAVDPTTSAVTRVEVAGVPRECRNTFVSTATLFRLISDHYECSEVRYGRLRGDWEKFEVWVQKSAAAFNVNERVSREVGERCSAMRRKEEDYGSPGSERKRRKVEGGGEEVSPLVERGGEIYGWIKEPVKI